MKKLFNYIIYIGRFQPFHKGHFYTVKKALKLANHVIILCGSANCSKSQKNPWNFQERKFMINLCFTSDQQKKISILALNDIPGDNEQWAKTVRNLVNSVVKQSEKQKIGLIGYKKDPSSFYLDLFPDWQFINVENYKNINATDVRNSLESGCFASINDKLKTKVKRYVKKTFLNY